MKTLIILLALISASTYAQVPTPSLILDTGIGNTGTTNQATTAPPTTSQPTIKQKQAMGELFYSLAESQHNARVGQSAAQMYGQLYAAASMGAEGGAGTAAKYAAEVCTAGEVTSDGTNKIGFWAKIGTKSKKCREAQMTARYAMCSQMAMMGGSGVQGCKDVIDDQKWAFVWGKIIDGMKAVALGTIGASVADSLLDNAFGMGSAAIAANSAQAQNPIRPEVVPVPGETRTIVPTVDGGFTEIGVLEETDL